MNWFHYTFGHCGGLSLIEYFGVYQHLFMTSCLSHSLSSILEIDVSIVLHTHRTRSRARMSTSFKWLFDTHMSSIVYILMWEICLEDKKINKKRNPCLLLDKNRTSISEFIVIGIWMKWIIITFSYENRIKLDVIHTIILSII